MVGTANHGGDPDEGHGRPGAGRGGGNGGLRRRVAIRSDLLAAGALLVTLCGMIAGLGVAWGLLEGQIDTVATRLELHEGDAEEARSDLKALMELRYAKISALMESRHVEFDRRLEFHANRIIAMMDREVSAGARRSAAPRSGR